MTVWYVMMIMKNPGDDGSNDDDSNDIAKIKVPKLQTSDFEV